nr:zinc knuckle CX2CX4HX4C [Tanacetum cinerariifolium]
MQAHPSTFIIYAHGTSSPSPKLIKQRIDVAATFEVPLTTVGDLHKLINDIEAGKYDELLSGMTNDDHMETLNAIGTICKSDQADDNNTDVIPCKVSHVNNSINLIVDESTKHSDHIIQSMDINTKSTSMLELQGRSSFARCLIEVNSEADLVDVDTIGIPSLSGDGFTKETIRVEYEWRLPRCDICKIFGHVHDHFLKKVATSYSSKKDNLSMSNSFSALNDEEDDDEEGVQNVYDESANLFQNTKAGGSSSFTTTT